MSFMTFIVFSWILFTVIYTIYGNYHSETAFENKFIKNTDIFYTIKQGRQENDDTLTICTYMAVIAAIIIPQIPQID